MHATTEADYEAANEWLNSLGDEIDSEDDIGLSTEASSPSDMYGLGSDSRHATPMSHTMHARSLNGRASQKPIAKPKQPVVFKSDAVDRRMKGDFRSGCRGVSWNRRMQAWLAFWMDGTTRRSKTFSSKTYGVEEARSLAIQFLTDKRKESGLTSPARTPDEEEEEEVAVPAITLSKRLQRRSPGARGNLSSVTTGIVEITKS